MHVNSDVKSKIGDLKYFPQNELEKLASYTGNPKTLDVDCHNKVTH